MAHTPIYTSISPIQIAIFVPEAEISYEVETIDESRYCSDVILLPI